jgi:hypothetical protein
MVSLVVAFLVIGLTWRRGEGRCAVTIQALYQRVSDCMDKLNRAAVSDSSSLALDLVVTQLRIRLQAGVYDPMRTFGNSQERNIARLQLLIDQLDQVMDREESRKMLVIEVVALAKGVVRTEGIPFYS